MKTVAWIRCFAAVPLLMSVPFVQADSAYPSHPLPLLSVAVRSDALVIPVAIAGKQYHFLLDTGTATMMIDNSVADILTRKTPAAQVPALYHKMLESGIYTTEGMLRPESVTLWESLAIAIGDDVIPAGDPWLGTDLSLLTQAYGTRIDGILGRDIFRRYSWQVDNLRHQLTVWQHAPETLDYPGCVSWRDSWDKGPQLTLDYHKSQMQLTVDSGADYSYIGEGLIKASHEQPMAAVLSGINQPMPGAKGAGRKDQYLISDLRFDRLAVGKLQVIENKDGMYGLGMNFFARFDDYLFMPDKMLFCYRQKSFTRDEPAPLRTLAVRYYARQVELFDNSSEAIAPFGLRNGDVLLEVNSAKVQPQEMDKLRHALADTPSGALTLRIKRGSKVKTLIL